MKEEDSKNVPNKKNSAPENENNPVESNSEDSLHKADDFGQKEADASKTNSAEEAHIEEVAESVSEAAAADSWLSDKPESLKEKKQKKEKKPWSKKKKAIVFTCIGVVAAALIYFVVFGISLLTDPMGQFQKAAQQVAASPVATQTQTVNTPQDTATASTAPSASASPSEDAYAALLSQADQSILKDIVNIMLIGVDYSPERKTWGGKHAYHSDVMIVCSINTKTNEIHLISLPRDTYAKIPGIRGIYKLNASIDCGGGWPKESGFKKVCEAASWMLGGIPVNYYYAVDMSAVKGLVDAIGGVDYNIDLNFKIQGRVYTKGQRHMNGQAVLDYFRVRKNLPASQAGDLNRINRQKELLVAIFDKLKTTNLLLKLPDILGSFKGSLYTNTTLAQTAGLAAYCYKVGTEKVYMHSMEGRYAFGIFNWNFVITDQNKRVDLINKVFGVKVKPYSDYDYDSAMALWHSMQGKVIVAKSKPILAKVKKMLDADAKLPEYVKPSASTKPSTSAKSGSTSKAASVPKGYRQYTSSDWALYNKAKGEMDNPGDQLMADMEKLCNRFGIGVPSWRVNYEKTTNQVKVDFN